MYDKLYQLNIHSKNTEYKSMNTVAWITLNICIFLFKFWQCMQKMFATMEVRYRLEITPNALVGPATKEAIAVRKVMSVNAWRFSWFSNAILVSREKLLTRAGFELAPLGNTDPPLCQLGLNKFYRRITSIITTCGSEHYAGLHGSLEEHFTWRDPVFK